MQNAQNVIEITDLCKSFGDIKAVNNLSFSVRKGQLFAFLGVNGAGKSTTISIISGQLKKDGGSVLICGKDIDCGIGRGWRHVERDAEQRDHGNWLGRNRRDRCFSV